jgi:hypothetical protein
MAGPSFIASDRTETAADGSFSMPKPHDEKMTIVVLAEAPSLCSSYVPASDGPISLELHRVATLEGTVRRAGKVVAAQVRMARKDGPAPYRLASGRDDGTFRVSDLVPGNYEVEVQGYDAGHMTNGATTRDTIALRIGETATRDFTLSTGVRIDVIVDPRNPDNKTFASVGLVTGHMTPARYGDVRKLFRTPAYRGANSLSIDKAGCIKTHFLDVPAGPYTVVAAMNVGSFSAGDDAPVAFVHVTAESEPLTARLDV